MKFLTQQTVFDEVWEEWIRSNLEYGVKKDVIFQVLLDNGFDYEVIKYELKYEPLASISQEQTPCIAVKYQSEKETGFDEEWKDWIDSNVAYGVNKDVIFRILLDNGFDYEAIRNKLKHEPSVSIDQINNPWLPIQQCSTIEEGAIHEGDEHKIVNQTIYLPNAHRINTNWAEIYVVDNFLNEQECQQLVNLIKKEKLSPSRIGHLGIINTSIRSSQTCYLNECNDPFVDDINTRICRYLGISPAYSESIQAQHYQVGEEYKPHHDYLGPEELNPSSDRQRQRTWTFLIYLNDTEQGGNTRFLNLDLSFTPKQGRAVIWNNLYPDGAPNPYTLHQAMPVEIGEKTIINKWFCDKGDGPRDIREPG